MKKQTVNYLSVIFMITLFLGNNACSRKSGCYYSLAPKTIPDLSRRNTVTDAAYPINDQDLTCIQSKNAQCEQTHTGF